MPSKKQLTIGLVGAGSALAIGAAALSTNGTFAQWVDSLDLTGGAMTAATFDTAAVGSFTWKNTTTGATVNPTTYLVSPGDKLEANQGIDVALQGDTLNAKVSVTGLTASGSLVSTDNLNGVKLTYTVLDKNNTQLLTGGVGSTAAPVAVDKSKVGTALDGTTDLTVKVNAEFLPTTSGTTNTQQKLDISSFKVSVEQA